MMEHPYLHELFKAVLLYDSSDAIKILKQHNKGKLIHDWEIEKAHQESIVVPHYPANKIGVMDVCWIMKHSTRDHLGHRVIYHEVKTGKYDFDEVWSKYRKHSSYIQPTKTYYGTEVGKTNSPLIIWAWPKYHEANKKLKSDKTKIIWFYPLWWLQPILKRRFSEIKDVIL